MIERIVKQSKLIVGIGIVIGISIALNMAYVCLFSVDRYVFAFDPLLAGTTQTSIKKFVENRPSFKKSCPALIAEELKKNFPCIEIVALELIAPRVLHVDIAATKPLVTINKNLVLADCQMVLSRELFASHRIDRLYDVKSMHIPALDKPHAALTESVKKLLPRLFSFYNVLWNDEFEVVLCDKHNPGFSIICNADTIPNTQTLNHCEQLKAAIVQQGTAGHPPQQQWAADVRFDKQIILFSTKGGRTHG